MKNFLTLDLSHIFVVYRMVKTVGGKKLWRITSNSPKFFCQFSQLSIELYMASHFPWQNNLSMTVAIFLSSIFTLNLQ